MHMAVDSRRLIITGAMRLWTVLCAVAMVTPFSRRGALLTLKLVPRCGATPNCALLRCSEYSDWPCPPTPHPHTPLPQKKKPVGKISWGFTQQPGLLPQWLNQLNALHNKDSDNALSARTTVCCSFSFWF